jgi:hypothetical protein
LARSSAGVDLSFDASLMVAASSLYSVVAFLISLMRARSALCASLPLAVLFPFCVFVIVAMLLKKPYAPGAARWYLLFALISMATGAFLSSEPAGAVFPGLGAALWLAYLTTSKRVAATYGSSDRTGG